MQKQPTKKGLQGSNDGYKNQLQGIPIKEDELLTNTSTTIMKTYQGIEYSRFYNILHILLY